jgi:hypothetical protein
VLNILYDKTSSVFFLCGEVAKLSIVLGRLAIGKMGLGPLKEKALNQEVLNLLTR